jgi:hypothetical protein
MLSNFLNFVNTKGSTFALPAHGLGGARAASLLTAHFALRNTASNSAEKKSSPSEGVAEGGGWGEEFRHARAVAKCFRRLGIKTSKQNNFQFLLRKIWRAGVKKLKENCFALLAEFRRAETRSEAIRAFSVQKRFELRSVIATSLDILKNQRCFVARSPRLRRVSLRKKPCISELNRKVGQIQIRLFGKANGGSACEAHNKQSLFPIFSVFAKGKNTKQVFPA